MGEAIEVDRVATVHEEDIGVFDPRDPDRSRDARQRRQFENAHRLPAQLGHRSLRFLPGDEAPRELRPIPERIARRRVHEGGALLDRLAEQLEQAGSDAGIADPGGREKEFHRGSPWTCRKAA